jgi:hypothetical protein
LLATGSAVTTRCRDGVIFNLLLKGETVILPTQARDRREENSNNQRFTQVVALQARLESLHAAKILSDEELYALEDVIADDAEAALGEGAKGGAQEEEEEAVQGGVSRMVALSSRMAGDAAFGRQLRRKFVP